jgi:hypothetical protein
MTLQGRGIARLSTVVVAAAVTAAGSAGAAAAAVTAFPHVTLAAAEAALPAAKTLPGGSFKLVGKVSRNRGGQAGVCNKTVTLHDLAQVSAVYSSTTSTAVSTAGTDWTLGVAVFATPAKAATAMRAIIAVERNCPTRQVYKGKGAHIGIHVTVSATYAVTGWTGYRTVEHQVIYTGKRATPVTQILVTLVRGNALVTIAESTTGTKVSEKVQDTRRRLVQTRLLGALTHPKG